MIKLYRGKYENNRKTNKLFYSWFKNNIIKQNNIWIYITAIINANIHSCVSFNNIKKQSRRY